MDEAHDLDDGARMPFTEHLRELRLRLRNSVIALFLGFLIAYVFKEELFVLMARPLLAIWQSHALKNPAIGEPQFVFGSVIEPFWVYFSLALWAGIFIASPLIFYQLWKFVAPGLYQNERRYGVTFAACSAICFSGGAAFCYVFVLPQVFDFLLGYSSSNIAEIKGALGQYDVGPSVALKPMLSMEQYLGFSRKLLLGFGLVFELPLLIFFLSLVGVVTHRSLWKFNRWWCVLAFIIGAVLTPPDVVSQLMMAGPLIVLYNLSIVIAWVVTRRREANEAALASGESI